VVSLMKIDKGLKVRCRVVMGDGTGPKIICAGHRCICSKIAA
jgi:hypothetical protein